MLRTRRRLLVRAETSIIRYHDITRDILLLNRLRYDIAKGMAIINGDDNMSRFYRRNTIVNVIRRGSSLSYMAIATANKHIAPEVAAVGMRWSATGGCCHCYIAGRRRRLPLRRRYLRHYV